MCKAMDECDQLSLAKYAMYATKTEIGAGHVCCTPNIALNLIKFSTALVYASHVPFANEAFKTLSTSFSKDAIKTVVQVFLSALLKALLPESAASGSEKERLLWYYFFQTHA